jgi:lactate dehydrogenase-like 2-hydroxyacid dehydrogenase
MSGREALLIGALAHTRKEWEDIAQVASKLHEYPKGDRADFIKRCKDGEFDGVFALYRSNDSNPLTGDFNEELLEVLPKSLKFVCHNGAGYNNIDIAACSKRGIQVSSTPIAVNDATADVAIFLMLGALRNIHQSYSALRQGQYVCGICGVRLTGKANGAATLPSVTTPKTKYSVSWVWAESVRQSQLVQKHSA